MSTIVERITGSFVDLLEGAAMVVDCTAAGLSQGSSHECAFVLNVQFLVPTWPIVYFIIEVAKNAFENDGNGFSEALGHLHLRRTQISCPVVFGAIVDDEHVLFVRLEVRNATTEQPYDCFYFPAEPLKLWETCESVGARGIDILAGMRLLPPSAFGFNCEAVFAALLLDASELMSNNDVLKIKALSGVCTRPHDNPHEARCVASVRAEGKSTVDELVVQHGTRMSKKLWNEQIDRDFWTLRVIVKRWESRNLFAREKRALQSLNAANVRGVPQFLGSKESAKTRQIWMSHGGEDTLTQFRRTCFSRPVY